MCRFKLVLTKSLRKKKLRQNFDLKGLKHMTTVIGRRGGGCYLAQNVKY